MSIPHFHTLTIARVSAEAAGSVALTFLVPIELRDTYRFKPGQFLTLRADIDGQSVRRSYSICSSTQRFARTGEIEVGIKPVAGGVFSNWAVGLRAGDALYVMPPDGRFTPREPSQNQSVHRVGFAAGSGITPLLSIIASTLEDEPASRFTLVYSNQRVGSIMFNEALQDLKDQYPARLTLIHLLSRQEQEVPLLCGRLDEAKVTDILNTLVPASHIDEAFICGPEAMIGATGQALLMAGLPKSSIHAERFSSVGTQNAIDSIAAHAYTVRPDDQFESEKGAECSLMVVLDGKTHTMTLTSQDKVLDVALAAGLDLPYACRGGVCCTCRARMIEGEVAMEKNFTLEQWEIDKGFVLTCQARPLTPSVTVSYDER
jgi:ring-1,2-phenylacetyl-CoA epoxidase subunit PaaE